MKLSLRLLLILNVFWVFTGCDPNSSPKQRRTDFSDSTLPTGNQPTEEDLQPLLSGSRDYLDLAPSATVPIDAGASVPTPPPVEPLKIVNPKLVIDVDKAEVDFRFEAKTDKGSETIHLKGPFDKSASPWIAHLYAVDQKILEERRVSASVVCLTAYYCDEIGVKIDYTINGKVETVYRESGVEGPRLATSGDGDDDQEEVTEESEEKSLTGNVPAHPQPPTTIAPSPAVPVPTAPAAPLQPPIREKESPPGEATGKQVTPSPKPSGSPPEIEKPKPRPVKKSKASEPTLDKIPKEALKDALIGTSTPIFVPLPPKHEFRVRGLPEAPPMEMKAFQAYGKHEKGLLKNSTFIPAEASGFVRKTALMGKNTSPEKDSSGAFTTAYGLDYIRGVAEELKKKYPDDQITLGTVSGRTGGRLSGHSSHQTGLDFDIYFLSKSGRPGSFKALGTERGPLSSEFDLTKNYDLFKTLITLHRDRVIIGFLHSRLIKALCDHAKAIGEPVNDPSSDAFQVFRHLTPERRWDSQRQRFVFPFTHHDHIHIRLKCNPADKFCRYVDIGLPAQGSCR